MGICPYDESHAILVGMFVIFDSLVTEAQDGGEFVPTTHQTLGGPFSPPKRAVPGQLQPFKCHLREPQTEDLSPVPPRVGAPTGTDVSGPALEVAGRLDGQRPAHLGRESPYGPSDHGRGHSRHAGRSNAL